MNSLLYIPICIILIIFLILFLSTHIIIEYDTKFTVKIKILFIKVRIFPLPFKLFNVFKKTTKYKPKKELKNKKSKRKLKNLLGIIKFIKKIIVPFSHTSKRILYHIKINEIYLNLGICGQDASEASIQYAKIQIVANNLLSRLTTIKNIKNLSINIYPNFIESETSVKFRIGISSRFVFILYELLIFSFKYAKMTTET